MDAAQAHGARRDGRRAGSFGLAGAFSFYPKNLGALGDGGAICTDDSALAQRARMLRHLGQRDKADHAVMGYNERLDGLQAAFLRAKLPHLDRWNQVRQELAASYREALPANLTTLREYSPGERVYHLFPVRLTNRDALAARLDKAGVQTGIHYAPALHEQSALRPFVLADDEFPEAAAWADEEISLPIFESLRKQEVECVATGCRP